MSERGLTLNINTGQAEQNVDALTGSLGSLGASIARMGTIIAAFSGFTALANQMTDSIQSAIEFESALADIQKVTSEFTADQLSGSIRQLASDIPIARSELGEIVEEAGRLGVEGSENIEEFTTIVSKLSVATNLTADEASKNFARIINVTDATINNMEELGSVVNELSNTMATSADEIVNGMQRSAAAASRFGLQAGEISAFASTINTVSATARRANTRLRRVFQELNQPETVSNITNKLEQLGEEGFGNLLENNPRQALVRLAELFRQGGRASEVLTKNLSTASRQALAGLAQNVEGLNQALETQQNQTEEATSLQREFEIQAGTTASRAQILSNNITNLKTRFGEELRPSVNAATESLIDFVESINKAAFGVTETTRKIETLIGSKALGKLQSKFEEAQNGAEIFGIELQKINEILRFATGDFSVLADAYNRAGKEAEETSKSLETLFSVIDRGQRSQKFLSKTGDIVNNFVEQINQGKFNNDRLREIITQTETFRSRLDEVLGDPEEGEFGLLSSLSEERAREVGTQQVLEGIKITDLAEEELSGLGVLLREQTMNEVDKFQEQTNIADGISNTISTQLETAMKDVGQVGISTINKTTDRVGKQLTKKLNSAFSVDKLRAISPGRRFDIIQNVIENISAEELRQAENLGELIANRVVNGFNEELKDPDLTISELFNQATQFEKFKDITFEDVTSGLSKNFSDGFSSKIKERFKKLNLDQILKGGLSDEDFDELGQNQIRALNLITNLIEEESKKTKKSLKENFDIELPNIKRQSQLNTIREAFGPELVDPFASEEAIDNLARKARKKLEKVPNSFRENFRQALDNVEQDFTNTITDMVIEGKAQFGDFFKSLGRQLVQQLVSERITQPISNAIKTQIDGNNGGGGSSSSISGLFGGGGFLSSIFGLFGGGGVGSSFAGFFDDGGTVPGRKGEPKMAVVHGQERILPPKSNVKSTGRGQQNVEVNVINKSGNEVKTERRQSNNGEMIDVVIEAAARSVKDPGGKMNQAMRDRFNLDNSASSF